MKKCISLILIIFMLSSLIAFSMENITVLVDGAVLESDVMPQIIEDRTMLPLRAIAESLGAEVLWNGDERKVTVKKESRELMLTIDSDKAYVNGEEKALDASAVIINSRTLVPLRFIGEALDMSVLWYEKERTVKVSSVKNMPYDVLNVTAKGHDGNTPKGTLDNDYNTRWSCEGDNEWILFELSESMPIGYIGASFYYGDQRLEKFSIHLSEDNVSYEKVWEGESERGLEMFPYPAGGKKAKYIKLVCNGNTANLWNSITEINIYPPTESGAMPVEAYSSEPREIIIPAPIKEALEEVENSIDKQAVLDFFISLYDSTTGGFYCTPSGRDMEGFLPDVESTAQILAMFPKEKMPAEYKEKLGKWVQSLQDEEDGYFYHPQWGKEINQERRGRDNTWAIGLLSKCDTQPLYKTVSERLSENAKGEGDAEQSAKLPEYLTSDEAFYEWISSLPWDTHPWGAGNSLNAVRGEIVAAGYYDKTVDFVYSQQNTTTGLWGVTNNPTIKEVSSVMKVSTFLMRGMQHTDKAMQSILNVLENYVETAGEDAIVLDMYNAWVAIQTIVLRCEDKASLSAFYEKAPDLLRQAFKNIEKFKKSDGGYSYSLDKTMSESMGAFVGMGLPEGDANATTISHFNYIIQAYKAMGVEHGGFFTDEQIDYFFTSLLNKAPTVKRNAPESVLEDFENVNTEEVILPNLWGNSSLEIKNNALYFETHKAGQNGFSINAKVNAENKRLVFETDLMFENDCKDGRFGRIRLGNRGYELLFEIKGDKVDFLDRPHWSENYPITGVAESAMKKGKWHTLKIEIEPDNEIHQNTLIKIYVDGKKVNENNRYYHFGSVDNEPTTIFTSILFESFKNTDGGVYFDNMKMYSEDKNS